MSPDASGPQRKNVLSGKAPDHLEQNIARLRSLSMKQRGEMIAAACRAAASIRRSRIQSGLPDVVPAPWPESTWEFLRKHAPNAIRSPKGTTQPLPVVSATGRRRESQSKARRADTISLCRPSGPMVGCRFQTCAVLKS